MNSQSLQKIAPSELESIISAYNKAAKSIPRRIVVCGGTGCIANGSMKVYEALKSNLEASGKKIVLELDIHDCSGADAHISRTGCQGFCQVGPLVVIEPDGILYTHVKPSDVEEIVKKTIIAGEQIERLLYKDPVTSELKKGKHEIDFYKLQDRRVMHDCGSIDPEDLNEYIAHGGYRAARKALFELSAQDICNTIKESGLRGRGGGGFPAGRKWELALKQNAKQKYIICNGDEGDPGAFMDRSVLEGNPHSVIEGMIIGAKASGATVGYVYVRAEYPLAVERMKKAVMQAETAGFLGKNIMGSGIDFELKIMEGAGAFVCGEASAMVSSIMGKRGMPKPKPPRTAEQGLWAMPTVVNNVETLAQVAFIIDKGPSEYRKLGTAASPGTKTYALTGHVANTGLIEVPFGATLKHIVFDIGGGVLGKDGTPDNKSFKAVQIGGPSGGCLTAEHLEDRKSVV